MSLTRVGGTARQSNWTWIWRGIRRWQRWRHLARISERFLFIPLSQLRDTKKSYVYDKCIAGFLFWGWIFVGRRHFVCSQSIMGLEKRRAFIFFPVQVILVRVHYRWVSVVRLSSRLIQSLRLMHWVPKLLHASFELLYEGQSNTGSFFSFLVAIWYEGSPKYSVHDQRKFPTLYPLFVRAQSVFIT